MRFADHQRVVVRQRDHAGAEPDALGALGRRGDEELRRRDDLEAGRVVLADPRLVVAEVVEPLDQLDVATDRQRRVFVQRVERCEEDAAAQRLTWIHERSLVLCGVSKGLIRTEGYGRTRSSTGRTRSTSTSAAISRAGSRPASRRAFPRRCDSTPRPVRAPAPRRRSSDAPGVSR